MQQAQQYGQTGFINVKVKTLNHSIYDIIANPLKNIRSFQNQIEQKTKVPIHAQRLLYRGIVLDSQKTLADYRIQEGNIIQLVANKIPSEYSHQSSARRSEINKAHNYTQEHNKTKKYRQLQQRVNGFRLRKQQSLQVLQQNKHTIDQLIQCVNLNFLKDMSPFKMERRKMEKGQWIDVKDASGQWIQGQVINLYGDYVLIHYNGMHSRWNQWISVSSDRIMPFRTHTVQQLSKTPYLSPFPNFERQINCKNNQSFKTNIETLIYEMSFTLDNLNNLIKELEFTQKDYSKQGSLQNVSNIETPTIYINEMAENQNQNDQDYEEQRLRKQQCQTPYKQNHMIADNSSNICQDDRSSKGGNINDDVSSKKSYKSKRSEGLVDTASMKSLKIDQSRKRQNKVFLDYSEQAQSVCSIHHKNKLRNVNTFNQQYILEEDSNFNQQQFEEANMLHKKQLKAKMRASQLAPLLDRMGRFLIDIAPHFAVLGHTDQLSSPTFNENLSTYTNQGSLLSKLSEVNRLVSTNHNLLHSSQSINSTRQQNTNENNEQQKALNNFCSFQVPLMLTPHEIVKLQKLIEAEKRNLHML